MSQWLSFISSLWLLWEWLSWHMYKSSFESKPNMAPTDSVFKIRPTAKASPDTVTEQSIQEPRDQVIMGKPRSTSTNSSRYRCIACGRTRSSSYHMRHPAENPPPSQGICRRCIEKDMQPPLAPEIMIYRIHHYYHTCICQHERPLARPAVEPPLSRPRSMCAELPVEEPGERSLAEGHLLERVPPPVAFWMKPGHRSS
jgi:hypothetical protein